MTRRLPVLRAVPALAAVATACLACTAWRGPQIEATCREGVPNGVYRLVSREVDVEGSYAMGVPDGVFRFRTPAGVRLAEIPYVGGRRDGVIRLWYRSEPATAGLEPRRLEAEVQAGIWDGASRYYYEDGHPRAEYIYVQGTLVGARAWNGAGDPVDAEEAEALALADRVVDERALGAFEDMLRANPPRCMR